MNIKFNHLLERATGGIELTVTASVYHDEIDDIQHEPAVELTADEASLLHVAAECEIAELAQACREESAYYDACDRADALKEGE